MFVTKSEIRAIEVSPIAKTNSFETKSSKSSISKLECYFMLLITIRKPREDQYKLRVPISDRGYE